MVEISLQGRMCGIGAINGENIGKQTPYLGLELCEVPIWCFFSQIS